MRKIPTLLQRDPDDRAHVIDAVTRGCEWVLAGEGVATRKYDGMCTWLDEHGHWWARREVKPGKTAPEGFVLEQADPVTGKSFGWEPMASSSFAKFHAEALLDSSDLTPGTYELCGPKVNGNPEGFDTHRLVRHGISVWHEDPRTIEGIKAYVLCLAANGYEGVVWHHPDGRMAKLKVRDLK